ncbi:MAG: rhomboid family intramembrane serine protease [Planctomycetota bacterium]
MKDLLTHADEIPATLVIALAYVTLAFLTNPFEPTIEKLDAFGMLSPFAVANGEAWRLVAAAFLHGGIVHLGFNTLMLMSIGPALERSLGSLRFCVLYLVAAVGGHIAVCLLYRPFGSVVGGSGALFGMMGALVAMNMRSGRHLFSFLDFEGPRRLLGLIVANLVIGFLIPFISNTAHVGGLVSGFAVTFLWLTPLRASSRSLWHWRLASAALYGSLLFASLLPVTRYEWLWNRSVPPPGEVESSVPAAVLARREELRRAAAMSYFHLASATDTDVARLVRDLFPPPDDKPQPR